MHNIKFKQDIIYIIIAILIIGGIYAVVQLINLYNKPSDYVLAKNGRITNYEQDVAYVVREEQLIDISNNEGEIQTKIFDNNRAKKGDVIAYFVQEKSEEQTAELKDIDSKIQELMKDVQLEYIQDIKNVENNLESNLYSLIEDKKNIYDLNNKKKGIDELLEKKVKLIAESSSKGSELKQLVNQRIALEKEISKNKVGIKTDKAGLISYRVDGYENTFTPNAFSMITTDTLKSVKYSTDQLIPISSNQVKIINNFYAYLIVVSKSEESKALKLNDTVRYTIDNNFNNLSKATVDYIINEDDTRYIFIKTTDNIEKLAQYRKLSVKIVWWNYQGIKISKQAIFKDNIVSVDGKNLELDAVLVQNVNGYSRKVWIKLENQVGDDAIVDNYEDSELESLGVPKNEINGRKILNLYDKVLMQK